jgi:hypothetical protein
LTPEQTGRLTVGRMVTVTLTLHDQQFRRNVLLLHSRPKIKMIKPKSPSAVNDDDDDDDHVHDDDGYMHHISIYLSIYPPLSLSVRPSIHPSVYLYIHIYIYIYIYIYTHI